MRQRQAGYALYGGHRFPQAYIHLPVGGLLMRNQPHALNQLPPEASQNIINRRALFQGMEMEGARQRVASHGPQLRNMHGDSQSLLDEDPHDVTVQQVPQGNTSSQSISNMNQSVNQALARVAYSDESVLELDDEEKHQSLPMRNHQMFLQFSNRLRSFGPGTGGPMNGLHGFSFDDGGMDEYDVADERAHLWEYINPDNMTYEEIIALQDRIGYVTKGLSLDQIN